MDLQEIIKEKTGLAIDIKDTQKTLMIFSQSKEKFVYQFKEFSTKEEYEVTNSEGNTIKVPMMIGKDRSPIRFTESDKFLIAELLYINGHRLILIKSNREKHILDTKKNR